jgi:SAM-dependent methyltransferase
MSKVSPERVESNALLREWCADVTGAVLSVGSGGDIDKEGRRYRDYFTKAVTYVTSDIVPGCDVNLDLRRVPLSFTSTFDAIFCSGVLEHVDDVEAAIDGCWRILRPNGVLLVGVPFKQPIHRAPGDFWRFTEFGTRYLLRAFEVQGLKPIGDPTFPFAYWAKAQKVLS